MSGSLVSRLCRNWRRVLLIAVVVLGVTGLGLGFASGPFLSRYHLRQAQRALARQRYPAAMESLDRALHYRPDSAELHLLAGRTARRVGDFTTAQKHLRECLRLQGDASEELQLEFLMLRAQTGELEQVLDFLLPYVDQNHPQSPLVLEALTRVSISRYRADLAARCLTRWLEQEPDNVEALFRRALWSTSRQDHRSAITDYSRALEIDPERVDIRLALAESLRSNGKLNEAAALYKKTLAQDPEEATARLGLARCWMDMGRSSEVAPLLDGLSPEMQRAADVLWLRGWLEMTKGRWAKAEPFFQKAISDLPGNRESRYQYLLCLRRLGKEAEAQRQAQAIKQIDKDIKRMEALTSVEMVLSPRNPSLRCELGEIFLRLGIRNLGVLWLKRALQLDPRFRPAHQQLLRYYEALGPDGREEAEYHRKQLVEQTTNRKQTPATPPRSSEKRHP